MPLENGIVLPSSTVYYGDYFENDCAERIFNTTFIYFQPDKGNPHISQLSLPAGLVNVQCLQDTLVGAGTEDDPAAVFVMPLEFPSTIIQKVVVRKMDVLKIRIYYLLP